MDIRSFFGGSKNVANATPAGPSKASPPLKPCGLNTVIRRSIDEDERAEPASKVVNQPVDALKNPEELVDTDVSGALRRKRLKKLVDSDDDLFASDNPVKSSNESNEGSKVKVRHLLWDKQEGVPLSSAEITGKTSDVQLDIDCYTTTDKRLVNPVANVTESRRQNVDLDSYLTSMGVGKSGGTKVVESTTHASPTRTQFIASVKPEEVKPSQATQSEVVSPKKSVQYPPMVAVTSPVAGRKDTNNATMDLFDDNESLPSSVPPSVTASPAKVSNKTDQDTIVDPNNKIVGMRFVFTGVLEAIDRDSILGIIRNLGGIPITGVSSKTNYLVCGDKLEDGRPFKTGTKYKKAVELNSQQKADIKILNESEFLTLINFEEISAKMAAVEYTPATSVVTSNLTTTTDSAVDSSLPYCEKYRPMSLNDLAGNEANIRKVVDWLRSWAPGSGPACALLSGPPGVGKTTTAKLVAAQCGYECVEFNASDLRNKSAVEKISMLATGGQSFSFMGECQMRRSLVLLDEVDGMGAGDRGGLQAVVALLPKARCPIICICNDRHNQKLNTLGNKSLDVRFAAPTLAQFRARLGRVCAAEGVTLSQETIAQLYEQGGGDFRHALNAIEFNAIGESGSQQRSLARSDAKDIGHTKNLFEATGRLFTVHSTDTESRFREMEQLFFVDYNMMPLMAQENYTKYIPVGRRAIPILQALSQSFVEADLVEEFLKRFQAFSLLPDLAVLSSILPAMVIVASGGTCRERLMFPQFLGRFSTTSKNKRFLSEIGKHLGHRSLIRSSALVMDGYLDILYTKIMTELAKGDIDATVAIIESCGLNRELAVDALSSLRLKSQDNLYEKIETRKKTALTKRLNEQSVRVAPTKRKKEFVDRIVDEEAEVVEASESESSDSDSELIKKNARPVKKRATATKKGSK
ncbi:replication factor C subunit [Babesia ovis]|uniref:Replication factor C subunit 1 n=1 Tax=Babesia ovis TaxID=5869 RepID=A0A9W5T843_BABOV|nr:replication factor C subunit [Babesia ovis]